MAKTNKTKDKTPNNKINNKAPKSEPLSDNNKVNQQQASSQISSKPLISYSDFEKLDLRIAKIMEVEDIEGKDKLYKLKISLGDEQRTIVAGIKQHYSKDELINKQIIIIANLEPAKIGGITSEGMLLAAVSEDKSQVTFLTPEKSTKDGSKVQ